jgi:hypothetical protein
MLNLFFFFFFFFSKKGRIPKELEISNIGISAAFPSHVGPSIMGLFLFIGISLI